MTGDGSAYARLAELARADLFLIPMDTANGWFRYHQLFRAALQHRLQSQAAPAQWASLHHTAAQWLAAADRVRAAVGHFLVASEGDAAAALVETWLHTTMMRNVNDARRLLGLLPASIVQRRPCLMLDRCFLAAMLDYEDGETVHQQAWATLAAHPAAATEQAAWQAEWWVWRSGADFNQRNLAAAAEGLAKVAPVLADLADHVVGAYWFIQMHLKSHAGDHAAAVHCGDQALVAFGRAGYASGTVAVQRELARLSVRRGDSYAATRRFQALLGSWQRDQISLTRDIAWTQILAAENSYLQNDLAQACVHQAAAAELAQQLQDGQYLFLTERMGQVYQALLAASAAACPPVAQAADHIHTAGFRYAFLELETSWLVASGQGERAWPLIQQSGLTISHREADYSHNDLMAYLRAYVARGEALADISALLAGAAAHFAATGARLRQLQVLALTAWQQLQLGDDAAAGASLAEAQRLAAETGYVRVVMDVPALVKLATAEGVA